MIRLNLPSFDIKVSGSKQHPQILDVLRRKFITLTPEEWVRQHVINHLVHDLGDKRYMMLRNHGLLTVGRTVAEAFVAMYMFETTCMIQVRAQSGGGPLRRIGAPILEGAQAQWDAVTRGTGGGLAWPALLRRLERTDRSYRH